MVITERPGAAGAGRRRLTSWRERALERARRVPAGADRPLLLALVLLLALSIAVVGGGGALFALTDGAAGWSLDAENQVPAIFSAGLLLLAGAATAVAVLAGAGSALVPVGALFVLMALDEYRTLHERVERATGLDWQLVYAPVFLLAAVCFLLAVRRHRREWAFLAIWCAGAVAWAASQVLEELQWVGDTRQPGYTSMMLTEEVLEMTGTACFVVAMALLALRVLRRPAAPAARA